MKEQIEEQTKQQIEWVVVNGDQATVTLEQPIVRGETKIDKVTVLKPNSGALRGVRLQPLMDMDVDSMMQVLPRITTPTLTKNDVLSLAAGDLVNLSVQVVNFFIAEVGYARFPSELTTDELAADIAVIFHWSPADTGNMSLSELLSWRYQAAKRCGQQDE